MKKPPPTPDVNQNAPRPRHLSSDTDDIPTMDSPPEPPDIAPGFDRATDQKDQEYRSGLLPGSEDHLAPENPDDPGDDIDLAEGVDPEPYKEFWAERQSFPQQDDPDQEGLWEDKEPDDLTIMPVEPEGEDAVESGDAERAGRDNPTLDPNSSHDKNPKR